jgi:DNA-binding HxlR family transcriptional regulator
LVERRALKDTAPQHVEYSLTALGTTLREPLAAICDWAAEHALHHAPAVALKNV